MKIIFLTTSLGVYGSIRELIENANRLVDYGHEVEIYSDLKARPYTNWLPCKAKLNQLGKLNKCDVLILMDSPFTYHMERFMSCNAKFKTMIMMGFPENFEPKLGNGIYNYNGANTEKNLMYLLNYHEICSDANWQLEHLKGFGIKTGVAIGGINLDQFKDLGLKRNIQIGYSGDERRRKLTSIIQTALKAMDFTNDFYYKKGDQKYLVNFLNKCDLFVDNHYRAGWVNPVLEAMACGAVPICRKLKALKDFATDKTAVVLDKPDKFDFMRAINYLMNNPEEKNKLKEDGKEKVKEFSYDIVSKKFEEYLLSKI